MSFERPAFQKMIADIESGKINCVITKDLSHLGRNSIEKVTAGEPKEIDGERIREVKIYYKFIGNISWEGHNLSVKRSTLNKNKVIRYFIL